MHSLAASEFSVRRLMNKIVGMSPAIVRIRRTIRKFAKSNEDILISGEPGVGKAMLACIIHHLSERRNFPFVEIHAIEFQTPKASSLSDHFSDKINAAKGGTIAIYHIEELPDQQKFQLQEFLLRLNGYKSVVAAEQKPRIIATTRMMSKGIKSEKPLDAALFFALNKLLLEIPPLRNRKQDIPFLFAYFLKKQAAALDKRIPPNVLTNHIYDSLMTHDWRGNIDELKNSVSTLLTASDNGDLNMDVLPFLKSMDPLKSFSEKSLPEAVEMIESYLLRKALTKFEGNQTKAAFKLKISEASLRYKLKKYQISNK